VVTLLVGFAFGFIGSMPIAGPVSAIVFERALEGRGRSAFFVATGSALAESAYAFMAAWGLSGLLANHPAVLMWSRVIGAVILIGLGGYFIVRSPKSVTVPSASRATGAFALGFTITAINPTLIVTWTAAVTALYASGFVPVSSGHALPLALGACVGIITWFSVLLALVRHYHRRIRRETMRRVVQATGVLLVGLGVWFGVRLILHK
jgi:threonine/homoserine/homoserine lactone efflux protein